MASSAPSINRPPSWVVALGAKCVALVMVFDVLLVLFHLSYQTLRPIYLRVLPALALRYDQVQSFWQIDRYFVAFFALAFLIRTLALSRRHPRISWGSAMLRRSYELLLLLPFWQWLRIIPMLIQVHRSGLVNLERPLAQLTHEPTAYLADRVSMFMLVRLVNQTQESVEQGEAARLLLNTDNYIQVGDSNTLDRLVDRLLSLTIYQVIPQVQPNLEALLRQSLENTFKRSDVYQGLKGIPGMNVLPAGAIEQLSDYLAQSTYEVLVSSYSDPRNRVVFEELSEDFKRALRRSLQEQATQQELQALLSDLLEEMKLNYIQRAVQRDPEATLTEVNRLQDGALPPPPPTL